MFKDLRESLRALKGSSIAKEKVSVPKKASELDLLARSRTVIEGVVPANASDMADDKMIKTLLEMAVKEDDKDPKDEKAYFGSAGDNIYYATIAKDDKGTATAIHVYDSTDEEVKHYENDGELSNAELVYNAVNDLNLDSVSYQLLTDLDLIKQPEEDKAKEEKPEEAPEEPKEEAPEPEEAPKEEEPAPAEEKPEGEEEEPKESVKEAAVDINQDPAKDPALKMDGAPAADPKVDPAGAEGTAAAPVKSTQAKDDAAISSDPNLNKDKAKLEDKPKLDDQKPEIVKQGAPVAKPSIEGAKVVSDSKDPAIDAAGKVAETDKLLDAKPKEVKQDQGAVAAGQDLNKGDAKPDATTVVGNTDKLGEGKVAEAMPSGEEPNADQKDEIIDTWSMVEQEVESIKSKELLSYHDLAGLITKLEGIQKLLGPNEVALKESLDVQKPDEYKKEVDALQKELEAGKISQADFENGKSELDKKYKAAPAGTTEGKVPSNASDVADDKMIGTLLEKHGLKEKK